MSKRHIAAVLFNLVFLLFNIWLFFKVQAFRSCCEIQMNEWEAKQVVHQFIDHVRHSNDDYPFEVKSEDLEIYPDDLALPYEVCEASPEGIFGYEDWEIRTKFENGYIYIARAVKMSDSKWLLESFQLLQPREVLMTRTYLRIFVNTAHNYMRQHGLSSANYRMLVDANCFSHYRYPFLDSVRACVDLSSFSLNDADSQLTVLNNRGDKVSYHFAPLKDGDSRDESSMSE